MQVRLILSEEGAKRLPFVQPEFSTPLQLGTVVGTEAAIRALNKWDVDLNEILASHRTWNIDVQRFLSPAEQHAPSGESRPPMRLSAFEIVGSKTRLWLLTDPERELTMLLLPSEWRQEESD